MRKITLKVNGIDRELVVDPAAVLLEVLREDLRLTGAKQSCDRKGQCGACTVIVNGQAVKSCLKKAVDLDGSEVITIEGLGTPAKPPSDSGSLCAGRGRPVRFLYPRDDHGRQSPVGRRSGPFGGVH